MNHLKLLALLLPIALTCAGSALITHHLRHTVSSTAWRMRERGNAWRWIDAVFGADHCQRQAMLEDAHGGVWGAWRWEWRQ